MCVKLYKTGSVFLLLVLLSSIAYSNQRVAVLVSNDPGAPTVGQIVNNFNAAAPASLFGTSPSSVYPLLPKRAEGDFLNFLQLNPDMPRAKLERYIIVEYSVPISRQTISSAIRTAPYVVSAYELQRPSLSTKGLVSGGSTQGISNWNLDLLNIPAARNYTGGGMWISALDTGIDIGHPDVNILDSNGDYDGGFIPHLSFDFSRELDSNGDFCTLVDERTRWEPISGSTEIGKCADIGTQINFAGHGTHVAGISSANYGQSYPGVCPECPFMASKVSIITSNLELSPPAIATAMTALSDLGVSAMNQSFGYPPGLLDGTTFLPNYCISEPNSLECLAIAHADQIGTAIVASAGNFREELFFFAADSRVIGVGGVEQNGFFWDDSPGSNTFCPLGTDAECGSNFSWLSANGKVDVVAPAKAVVSTLYRGFDWNPGLGCAEPFTGAGFGPCTGTSMAAPHVLGLIGMLRSVSPLVPLGTQEPVSADIGIRSVLNESGSRTQAGLPHDLKLGYGIPDAEYASKQLLGASNGTQLTNRLTPLFAQYSSFSDDFHYTISPQIGQSRSILQANSYGSAGSFIAGYPIWPVLVGTVLPGPPPPMPSAQVFVLTTKNNPFGSGSLVPLYRMTYEGGTNTNPDNQDMAYAISASEVNSFASVGYRYEGIEGFLLPLCSPEPSCIPDGAVKILRRYNSVLDDHAIFPETELATMISSGYTGISATGELGYAFPNIDADGDTLIDGQELLLGTDPNVVDSDCDGIDDGQHYPVAGVPVSDPLAGDCNAVDIEVTLTGGGTQSNPATVTFTNLGPAVATNAVFQISLGSSTVLPVTPGQFPDANSACQAINPGSTIGQVSLWQCEFTTMPVNQPIQIPMYFCGPKSLFAYLLTTNGISGGTPIVDQNEINAQNNNLSQIITGIDCGPGNGGPGAES